MAEDHCVMRTVLVEAMLVVMTLSSVTGLSNIFCNVPQEKVVAIDPANHGYYPFFVKLHRCVGSNGLVSPSVQRCVATRFTEFPLTVHSIISNDVRTVMLTNHTGCGAECVTRPEHCDLDVQDWNENMCSCVCKHPDGPPQHKKCKDGFRWSRHRCQCVCSKPQIICPIRQVWSPEACGCTCEERVIKRCARKKMGLNIDDCSCVNVQAISNPLGAYTRDRMFITLLAGQTFLIIILICVLVHWIRKKRRSNPDAVERLDSLKSEDETPPRYCEVPTEVCSSQSLEENSKEFDDSSCTVPLSPRMTNL